MMSLLHRSYWGITVIIIGLGMGVARADEKTPGESGPLADRDWAMMFQVRSDFNVDEYLGGMISLLRQTSENRAWRLGAFLRFGVDDIEQNRRDQGSGLYTTETDIDQEDVSILLQRVFYPQRSDHTAFFVAVGPRVSGSRSHRSTKNTPRSSGGGSATETVTDRGSWGVGFAGALGVEWFAGKAISLVAEYGSVLEFLWSSDENNSYQVSQTERIHTRVDKIERSGLSLQETGVKFGVAVHW